MPAKTGLPLAASISCNAGRRPSAARSRIFGNVRARRDIAFKPMRCAVRLTESFAGCRPGVAWYTWENPPCKIGVAQMGENPVFGPGRRHYRKIWYSASGARPVVAMAAVRSNPVKITHYLGHNSVPMQNKGDTGKPAASPSAQFSADGWHANDATLPLPENGYWHRPANFGAAVPMREMSHRPVPRPSRIICLDGPGRLSVGSRLSRRPLPRPIQEILHRPTDEGNRASPRRYGKSHTAMGGEHPLPCA